jgi:hypothetical protein
MIRGREREKNTTLARIVQTWCRLAGNFEHYARIWMVADASKAIN